MKLTSLHGLMFATVRSLTIYFEQIHLYGVEICGRYEWDGQIRREKDIHKRW